MVDKNAVPVLIDFDSVYIDGGTPEGAHKSGSPGWADPSYLTSHLSREENDYYGFDKLTTLLRG